MYVPDLGRTAACDTDYPVIPGREALPDRKEQIIARTFVTIKSMGGRGDNFDNPSPWCHGDNPEVKSEGCGTRVFECHVDIQVASLRHDRIRGCQRERYTRQLGRGVQCNIGTDSTGQTKERAVRWTVFSSPGIREARPAPFAATTRS